MKRATTIILIGMFTIERLFIYGKVLKRWEGKLQNKGEGEERRIEKFVLQIGKCSQGYTTVVYPN